MIHIYGGEKISLHQKSCIPCRGDVPPLNSGEIKTLKENIDADWSVVDNHHLSKQWLFDNFAEALKFLNQAGEVCEQEGHHANFECGWGFVKVLIWTHKIDGLTESDFILAAKIDHL